MRQAIRDTSIFDTPRFAGPLRERIRAGAEALAAAHGVQIEDIRQAYIRRCLGPQGTWRSLRMDAYPLRDESVRRLPVAAACRITEQTLVLALAGAAA